MASFTEDVTINGDLTVTGEFSGDLNQNSFVVRSGRVFQIPLTDLRIWDAFQTALSTAANDDLGLTTQTFGSTGAPYVTAGDVKAGGTVTRRARVLYAIPHQYVNGQALSIRVIAGMVTTVAATSCTVDVEAHVVAATALGYSGADIVTAAAQSINSLSVAAKDFSCDAAAATNGDVLDIRITVVSVDAATGTAVIPVIPQLALVCTTRP